MPLQIEELNDGTNCKTYLVSAGKSAALVDPLRERLETYRRVLSQRGLALELVLETHTHADHLMLNWELKKTLGATVVMHRTSPSPLVDRHVDEGDVLELAGEPIRVIYTPGHTPDSVCYRIGDTLLSGDTLLIGGSGRTDFPGGDAGAQYDAVTQKLFGLPQDTIVLPAHDYRGATRSSIGHERLHNPRFAGKSRQEYVTLMSELGLPLPDRAQQALQVNQSGFESDEVSFPLVADVARTRQISADELVRRLRSEAPPLVLDVREPEEFVGPLGHIQGALLIPLDLLELRLPKLAGYVDREIVLVCRAGARSASACAMLENAGFAPVMNLAGGMLAWKDSGLPVQG
jgi:glyoxylase-like metal-dependent hydrolase (beta-lactamase superfamily II)/rhodanese-related sulfurtransferase